MLLRRRVSLKNMPNTAVLRSVGLSALPDPVIALVVQPQARLKEPLYNAKWPDKNNVSNDYSFTLIIVYMKY